MPPRSGRHLQKEDPNWMLPQHLNPDHNHLPLRHSYSDLHTPHLPHDEESMKWKSICPKYKPPTPGLTSDEREVGEYEANERRQVDLEYQEAGANERKRVDLEYREANERRQVDLEYREAGANERKRVDLEYREANERRLDQMETRVPHSHEKKTNGHKLEWRSLYPDYNPPKAGLTLDE